MQKARGGTGKEVAVAQKAKVTKNQKNVSLPVLPIAQALHKGCGLWREHGEVFIRGEKVGVRLLEEKKRANAGVAAVRTGRENGIELPKNLF